MLYLKLEALQLQLQARSSRILQRQVFLARAVIQRNPSAVQ